MRAWRCHQFGDYHDLKIEDLPDPEPGPGEVLVDIKAAGVGFVEMLMCQGKYQLKPPLPFTPGGECAGDIIAVGEGVTQFKSGDKVMGGGAIGQGVGIYSERFAGPAANFRQLPAPFGYREGASFTSAYITAYVALVVRGELKAGETLLVHGAAGGVGLAAVEMGKMLGATVIATGGDDEKLAVVKQKGADHVINYTKTPRFRDQVKEIAGGTGADVIYDPVGGDIFDESTRCINIFGRLLIIGFTSGRIPSVPVNLPLIKQFSVIGVRAGEYGRQNPKGGRKAREELFKWAEEGRLTPHIHKTLPFESLIDAFDEIADRKVVGRIVLEPRT
ncbi:MAG: NADPH:quinone oxidoreductase family protein [Alphaproteobacteria bacterium]